MVFPLGALLLLSLGPALTRENNKKATQTEDFEVFEGDNATLQCCWRNPGECLKWRVEWKRNNVVVRNTTAKGCCATYTENATTCCDNLTLPNITRNHDGLYVCKITIDIPTLWQFNGTGTNVTVRTPQSPAHSTTPINSTNGLTNGGAVSLPAVVSLTAAMAAAFGAALIFLWKLHRGRALDRAARVIYEIPHGDSEVDGTGTGSSQGSSQWCQVPVYESFDYFERVEERKAS